MEDEVAEKRRQDSEWYKTGPPALIYNDIFVLALGVTFYRDLYFFAMLPGNDICKRKICLLYLFNFWKK